MPSPVECANARSSLTSVRSLKRDFDVAFETAVASGKPEDVGKAQVLRSQLEEALRVLREQVRGREMERLFNLKEQYEAQTSLLKEAGLLESKRGRDASGREVEILFMKGIDGKEYPLPAYETVLERLEAKKELLEMKNEQGFGKLALVPFGMSLDAMVAKYKQFLLDYKQGHPDFDIDTNDPLYVWDGYNGADQSGSLVYDPSQFDANNHQGKTKQQILEQMETSHDSAPGWRILLLQRNEGDGFRGIPRAGAGKTDAESTNAPRGEIEAGKTPREYLAFQMGTPLDTTTPYSGEYGMTPEEWMILAMEHLKQTGKPLDDYGNNTDSIAYLTGAYFTAADRVPRACWRRGNRRADLDRGTPGSRGGSIGVRAAVRV